MKPGEIVFVDEPQVVAGPWRHKDDEAWMAGDPFGSVEAMVAMSRVTIDGHLFAREWLTPGQWFGIPHA